MTSASEQTLPRAGNGETDDYSSILTNPLRRETIRDQLALPGLGDATIELVIDGSRTQFFQHYHRYLETQWTLLEEDLFFRFGHTDLRGTEEQTL